MSIKWHKMTVYETASTEPSYYFHLSISNPQIIREHMLATITKNDAVALEKRLNELFIYEMGKNVYERFYKGDHHVRTWEQRYCLTRPIVEALLFDYPSVFKEILVALKGKELLIAVFLQSLKNSSIPQQALNSLDSRQMDAIQSEIRKLQEDTSYPAAKGLTQSLMAHLETMKTVPNGLDALESKLDFLEILHSQDKVFSKETNYKCIIGNISMILLGFIPNILNLVFTGNFLFFKNTPAQERVENIDSHFSLFRQAKESFKKECPDKDTPQEVNLPPGFRDWTRAGYF